MGPFALRAAGQRLPLGLAGNTKRLFMLLAANANRGLRRDRIVDEIFPERPGGKASAALNTAIWRIKAQISPHPGVDIETIDDVIRLQVTKPARLDTLELEDAVKAAKQQEQSPVELCESCRERLDLLVTAIHGEFLEGVAEHWVLPQRERYAALMIEALSLLMHDAAAQGAYEQALGYGRDILELDPFREGTQCEVMWLYMQNRQRVHAIRQYQKFKALLQAELDIDPMDETRDVYESILCASPPGMTPLAERPVFRYAQAAKH